MRQRHEETTAFLCCHSQGQAMVDRLRNIEERTEKDIVDWTNRLPDVVLGELDKGVVCRGGGTGSASLRRAERCQVSMRLGQSMTSPQISTSIPCI